MPLTRQFCPIIMKSFGQIHYVIVFDLHYEKEKDLMQRELNENLAATISKKLNIHC